MVDRVFAPARPGGASMLLREWALTRAFFAAASHLARTPPNRRGAVIAFQEQVESVMGFAWFSPDDRAQIHAAMREQDAARLVTFFVDRHWMPRDLRELKHQPERLLSACNQPMH